MRVLTLGGSWADLFQDSLARQLAKIHHVHLGNPRYQVGATDLEVLEPGLPEADQARLLQRLNHPSRVAAELLWRFDWFLAHTDLLLIDAGLLDTAIGQHCLEGAQVRAVPAYGVGVDSRHSPLAAAFLKAILYPQTPDDLVRLAQHELQQRQKTN
jgi:hypothetical protein